MLGRELLQLAKSDRTVAENRFAALARHEQDQLILNAAPADRLELILLGEHTQELVRALPENELHRTVKSLGKWECQELVEVASEGQINFMLDHDCWRGDKLDSRTINDWIRLFMDCADDQVFRLLTAINVDTLALVLKKHVKFDHDLMIADQYYCDPDWVSGSNATIREFLERLYALEPGLWIRLMGWIRTHSKATIEADAVQGHDARLNGKGFPAPSLAITVYYPVDFDVEAVLGQWQAACHCGDLAQDRTLPAEHRRQVLFLVELAEAVKASPEATRLLPSRLTTDLIDIANKVMIADQVDLGDLARQRQAIDKVQRWTNIGLELASSRNIPMALDLIRQQRMEYFFRLGSMLFDALGSAVVDIEKQEQRSGGVLAAGSEAALYFPLLEPEPHIPNLQAQSCGSAIATLGDYRYAWQLVWHLRALLQGGAGPGDD